MQTSNAAPRAGASLPRRFGSIGTIVVVVGIAALLPVACQRGGGGGGGGAAPAATITTTWAKTYGHEATDQPESLVAVGDGSALICGGGSRAYVVRADDYGDPLWSRLWSTGDIVPGMGEVSGYGPTIDGGYVAWGRESGGPDQTVVLRLDADGELLWSTVLDGIGEFAVGAVDPQGGSCFAQKTADDRIEFVALDADGGVLWSSTPSEWILESSAPLGALAITSAGDVLVAGRLSSKELLFASVSGFDGAVGWAQTFAHGDGDAIRFHELRSLAGDEWSLAVERQDAITTEKSEILFRGSTIDGGLLEITTIDGPIADSVSWVSRLADGGALVVGSEVSMDGVETAVAHRFDSAGSLTWSQSIVDASWDSATVSRALHLHELDDGAILVRGEFEPPSSFATFPPDLFVARVEPDGTIGSLLELEVRLPTPIRAVATSSNPGDSYLLAGSVTRDDEPARPYPWFAKIDSTAQPAWERVLSTSYEETIHAAVENLTRDGFVVCGSSYEYERRDFPERQPVLFEVDASGALRWALTPAYPEPATAIDLVRTAAGYHCLVEVGYSRLALLEIGTDGTLLSDRTLEASSGYGEDLVATTDAYWVRKTQTLIRIDRVTGALESFSVTDGYSTPDSTFSLRSIAAVGDQLAILASFESDLVVALLDANLDVIWALRHDGGSPGHGSAVAGGPDGSVWVAGGFAGPESDDMWVVAFESTGELRHQTRYASLAHESAREVEVGADGSALVGGTTALLTGDPEGAGDQWILRVDSLGRVTSSCPDGVGVPTGESFVPMAIQVDFGPAVATTAIAPTPLDPVVHLSPFEAFETTSQCVGVATPQLTSLTLDVDGMGTVTNADPPLECSGSCWFAIPTDSTLDLVATPDPGWIFAGWSGDYSGSPIVAVDSVSITATFTQEPAGPPITVSDSVFDPDDWAIGGGEGGVASETDEQLLGPNPYRKMRTELPSASASYRQYVYTAFEYDPSSSGAIRTIDFAEQRKHLDSSVPPPIPFFDPSAQVVGAFVLVQDGRIHEVAGSAVYDADWTTFERVGLEPDDFTPVGGVLPDFSASGGKIRFGYRRHGLNLSDQDAWFEHAIDDWTVTIHR